MKNVKTIKVTDSSIIAGLSYNSKTYKLTVLLTGGAVYEYSGVPATVARDFASAESKGSFYNRNICGTYDAQKAG